MPYVSFIILSYSPVIRYDYVNNILLRYLNDALYLREKSIPTRYVLSSDAKIP